MTLIKPNSPLRSFDSLSQILAILGLGMAGFLIAVGPAPLNPQNIAWINGFDPTEHYLGWVFYRYGPWTFPLGLSPDFGLDIGASIVYADTIPLLSFLFKPFTAILPNTFQYFGWWLLLCFILQATFANQLCKLFITDHLTQFIAIDESGKATIEVTTVLDAELEDPETMYLSIGDYSTSIVIYDLSVNLVGLQENSELILGY